jgi:short-subunit dehydrogenase
VVAVTRVFLPDLISRPESHLVNVASASGLIGLPYGATYASSKWGVVGFSESVRAELAEQGQPHVGVTTVCPSYVSTGLFDGARPPLTTRVLTPERVAALTVRAVRRRRSWVLTPWLVKITPAATALLPTPLADRVSRLLGVTSGMASWKGHAD